MTPFINTRHRENNYSSTSAIKHKINVSIKQNLEVFKMVDKGALSHCNNVESTNAEDGKFIVHLSNKQVRGKVALCCQQKLRDKKLHHCRQI